MSTRRDAVRALWWKSPTARTIARVLRGRFTGLTVVVVGLMVCASLVQERGLRELIDAAAFSVLLFFAVSNVGRGVRLPMLIVAAPAFLGHWSLRLGFRLIPQWLIFTSSTAILCLLTVVVLISVLRDEAITADTIVGAVCAYFLMGVTWGTAYAMVELLSPGSFWVTPALAPSVAWGLPTSPVTPLLMYYSFTTLTTLGIGDISPLDPGARILTAIEGVSGQLYLAVLIARLVGIHTARISGK